MSTRADFPISDEAPQHYGLESSLNYYWDVATLSWVKGTQPGAGGGGDGAIVDGVTASIKATVKDYTNSNPLAVVTVDTNGDPVSAGGGTQYAEDTASAAGEIVTMAGVVRKDAAATLVDLDGDRTELEVDGSGRLWVNGSGVTQPVSGTFWQATQPVSGPLTDAELRAVAVPVSGPLTDAQLRAVAVPVSGTVTASGPLTDAQLRASAVPVSGPLTDAQLRATAVPVSGTVSVTEPVSVDDNAGSLTVDQATASSLKTEVWGVAKGTTPAAAPTVTEITADINAVGVLAFAGTVPWVTSLTSTTLTATVTPAGDDVVVDGRDVVATAGTRVQMQAQACKAVAVTAETDNTGIVVVGAVTCVAAIATRRGVPLSAGDSAMFAVDNVNRLYLDSTVSGDGVTWAALG